MSYAEQASFYRAALLLGLSTPEAVIAWADGIVRDDAAPPSAIIDVALAPAELTALRSALAPLALIPEPESVVHRLLVLTARDLATGRRSVDDTVRVFTQMRRLLRLASEIETELNQLENNHMLAAAGVTNDLDASRERVRDWLARFEG